MNERSDQERVGGETSLAAMAVEFWKVLRASERTLQSIPDTQRERFASQLRYASDRLDFLLREQNMSIEAFDGMEFEVNLPASAVNGDEFAKAICRRRAYDRAGGDLQNAAPCDGQGISGQEGMKMYLGIDLGTSNSAIVGNDGDLLRLFKAIDGSDVLPSAIMLDRRGGMFVGKRAYEQDAFSPENVGKRFKRLMGTKSPVEFKSAGRSMSPEDASAEILKTLLAQAEMAAGSFEMEGTVITIPAAFNQMQCEATMRAAQAAGIQQVGLVQEPIAAAMASMADRQKRNAALKDGQFLVYDLGGGTFDVAIVQSVGGTINVVGHGGINMLGGTDFDRTVVNGVVRPWLMEHFDLPDDLQKFPEFQRVLRIAASIPKGPKSTFPRKRPAAYSPTKPRSRPTTEGDRISSSTFLRSISTRIFGGRPS